MRKSIVDHWECSKKSLDLPSHTTCVRLLSDQIKPSSQVVNFTQPEPSPSRSRLVAASQP